MKWTRLELAILAMIAKLPNITRSVTPRERHLVLTVIRMGLVGIVLVLMYVPVELVAAWSSSTVVAIAGIVLFALGAALLIIAMILARISSILGG